MVLLCFFIWTTYYKKRVNDLAVLPSALSQWNSRKKALSLASSFPMNNILTCTQCRSLVCKHVRVASCELKRFDKTKLHYSNELYNILLLVMMPMRYISANYGYITETEPTQHCCHFLATNVNRFLISVDHTNLNKLKTILYPERRKTCSKYYIQGVFF